MQFLGFVATALALVSLSQASALGERAPAAAVANACPGKTVTSVSYIGPKKDVKVETISCANDEVSDRRRSPKKNASKPAKSSNVCGAQCDTYCFYPRGGGPDPNECHVISDALKFQAENSGDQFTMDPAQNTSMIQLTYKSCSTFILDQTKPTNKNNGTLTYCNNDWASLVDIISYGCQAPQNAHGGLCVAADQRWFVQVNHS